MVKNSTQLLTNIFLPVNFFLKPFITMARLGYNTHSSKRHDRDRPRERSSFLAVGCCCGRERMRAGDRHGTGGMLRP